MWHSVDLVWTNVLEERVASIFRVEKSVSEEPTWAGGCSHTQDICGATSQKTAFFIVTAVKTSNLTHTHVWLLWHFTMTYHSSDCLIDNRRFLLPCGLNLYFLHKLKATVDEWNVQQKLLFSRSLTEEALCCTDYEIITKIIVPPETLLQLQWHILWR
jgi:hypothetical protein